MSKTHVDAELRSIERLREIRELWASQLHSTEDDENGEPIIAARRDAILRLDQYIEALEQRFALRGEFSAETQGWIEGAALRWFGQSSGMRRTQVPDVQERR